MSKISEVVVKGISLVMKGNTPAVQHAQAKFAIIKSQKSIDITKLEEIEKKLHRLAFPENEGTICGPCGVDEK